MDNEHTSVAASDDEQKPSAASDVVGTLTTSDALPICLTIARSIESKQWKQWPGTWAQFKRDLSEHREVSKKDGPAYLPGKLNGTERRKNAVERLDLLVLDSDRGADLKEIASRLRALGYAAVVHSSYSHLSCQSLIKFDDYKRHTGTGEVTAEGAQAYLIEKKGFRPEVLADVTIIEAMRLTPNGIFIVVGHAPIQKGRIIVPLLNPYVITVRMQAQGLSQRQAQELWAYYFEEIPGRALDLAELDAEVATSVKENSRLARPQEGRAEKKTDEPSADLKRFAAKYGKTFLLADAIETQAPDKVRGQTTSVTGIVVECPFDEYHTNSGDEADKACFVMNPGEHGGFVWKCHHASCQNRDRLDFFGKAIADGWFNPFILDMAEYHDPGDDPCIQATTASASLTKESSLEETGKVFRLTVECDEKLVHAAVLRDIKSRTGMGIGEAREILKDYEKKARAETRSASAKPHFIWLTQDFDEIIASVSQLLVKANTADPRKFRMASTLVRLGRDEVTDTLLVEPITREVMRQEISGLSTWGRMEVGVEKSIGCPGDVAGHLLSDPELALPALAGIVDAPFFDENGNLVRTPGYHAESYTFYHPRPGFEVPPVSPNPSSEEIVRATRLLMEDIDGDFPFSDSTANSRSSKAHAVALKLEPFVRQLIKGVTPIYLIQKPTPGTGATLFVNAFAQVAFGAAAVPQAEVHNPDELRKNLTATLMSGTALYWIDNVHHKVDNASLALATTTEVWKDRVLGHSKTVVLPVRCTWIISGNNVQLSSELARRAVLIRLDANVERPTERKDFRHPNLLGFVRVNRGELVWACLTLTQAWIAVGTPAGDEILASYEAWSSVIGGILKTVGIEGFLENRDELKEVAADDDAPIKTFVQLMYDQFGTKRVPVSQPEAGGAPEIESLLELYRIHAHDLDLGFNDKRPETWPGLLGRAINKYKDRVFEISTPQGTIIRVKLRTDRTSGNAVKWLEALDQPSLS